MSRSACSGAGGAGHAATEVDRGAGPRSFGWIDPTAVTRNWPSGTGTRGFSSGQRGQQQDFPTHLLSGAMVCGQCGASIAQVSGKGGGYYGCLAATRGACDNKLT